MANQDISQILRAIENQNKELERLIEENQRLASSPYDLSSIERLQVLSKETREYFQQLEETLKDTNEELVKIDRVKYGNFFKNSKNILKDIILSKISFLFSFSEFILSLITFFLCAF